MKSIATALRHGALPKLQEVTLSSCIPLGEQNVLDFADALEHSDCANRFESLQFDRCNLSAEGVRSFAGPLSRGAFPALKELDLQENYGIGDEGGVDLAEALLEATQTGLVSLD